MEKVRPHLGTLVDEFERHAADLAVVAPAGLRRRRITYAGLAKMARRFGSALEARGIAKGERVLLWGANGPEWIASFFGCVLLGVVVVPLDFASRPEFVRHVEEDVAPRLIVGDRDKIAALSSNRPALAFEEFAEALPQEQAQAIPSLVEEDTLQIVFTSGTTGDPKGVVHTHKNVLASLGPIESEMQKYLKYERLVHPVRILHTLPLSHVFGQFMGLWVPALMAAEVHYEPRLVAQELVDRIRQDRISVLAAVPRVLDLLRSYVVGRDPDLQARVAAVNAWKAWQRWWRFRDMHRLFGLKFWAFVCGGAALSPGGERFWNAMGFIVIQGYGMTETTALVSLNHPFRAAEGTIGQVLPGREVKLSEEGEVLVRGDTIANTTWRHGQLERQDSEWLATGDLAEFDPQGNLRFRGRKKDVIVTSSGLNIYPEDLEAALNRQAGVKAAAVIENTAEHGPEPVAVLVVNDGASAADAVRQANAELAEYQQMQRWLVWPEPDFPRTSTGKILKREIAQRVAAGDLEGQAEDGTQQELNLDSLGRVQLQAQLEQQYGVALDDAALQQVRTEADVQSLVRRTEATAQPVRRRREEHVYPRWPWTRVMQGIRSVFIRAIAMPLVRFLAKPRVLRKLEEAPKEPALIVCNHVTSYDVPFILYALPGRMRKKTAVAMSGEMILDWRYARNQGHWFLDLVVPIVYWLVTGLFNVFPLPQRSGFRQSFRHAGEAMDRGYNVLVFPEGRRSDNEAAQPFKLGAGLLWKELRSPAVPVRLHGLGYLKESGERWFRSGRVTVSVGRLLPAQTEKSPEELTKILRDAVFSQ